jgi:hypothetical protein
MHLSVLKCFLTFISLKTHNKRCELSYKEQQCRCKLLKTLHPGEIRTRDLLFRCRRRWPCRQSFYLCFFFVLIVNLWKLLLNFIALAAESLPCVLVSWVTFYSCSAFFVCDGQGDQIGRIFALWVIVYILWEVFWKLQKLSILQFGNFFSR